MDLWAPPEKARDPNERLKLLPREQISGLLRPPDAAKLLPLGNLPALLRIASQNPALAEAFQERCETLAAANPALTTFIEELFQSAGLGLVRTAEAEAALSPAPGG